jgi:hypothetical protein
MPINGSNTVNTMAIIHTSGTTNGELILAANSDRYHARLQSYTTQAVYIGLGAVPNSTNCHVILDPSTALNAVNPNTILKIEKYQGAVYAYCCSSGAYISAMEVLSDG